MARHRLNTPTPTAAGDFVTETASDVLAGQKWFQTRKNSLVQLATGALHLISMMGFFLDKLPAEWTVVTNVVVFVLGIIIQASMKGVMTPSLVDKLGTTADEAAQGGAGAAIGSSAGDSDLPVYEGPLSS